MAAGRTRRPGCGPGRFPGRGAGRLAGAALLACLAAAGPGAAAEGAGAQGAVAPAAASAPARGPVTNMPLPRFVSLKAAEGNARRGPSMGHRIDWVYTRRAMPLQVTAEFGHWRQVRDRDGAGGWVHYALLSGVRTVLVERDLLALRDSPEAGARVRARAEAGVVARLGRCVPDWCRITAGRHRGWAEKAGLWGVGADELRD